MLRSNLSEPALHVNEIDVKDKYNFLRQIGKGSYGEVWLVVPLRHSSSKSSSKQYVLKRLDLKQQSSGATQNDLEGAEREAKLLSTLKHPNIVAYIESFRSNDGFLNIVMAYCEGGDLYTKLKERKLKKEPLTENQIVEWFVQICMALQYMHDKSILHRDLKTQNIFLTKNEIVKVGDLGIARVLDSGNDLATTIIGTPYYMSPEIFSNKPYGQKSDIWALGCCVYEMTTLEHAFNAKDMNALVIKIIRGQTPQTSKKYSNALTTIIKTMLSKTPEERPTAKKILQNPYIKQHILQLLEKTKIRCQNQTNSSASNAPVSVPVVAPPPPPPPSVTPPPSSSPPSRPESASSPSSLNNAIIPTPRSPHSSSNSPSSKKNQPARFSNHSPAVLPSYPPLPPSHHRQVPQPRTTSSSGSSSSADASRSLPSAEPVRSSQPLLSDSRARRHLKARANKPLPVNEQPLDLGFLSKLSQNDTLQRRKRDQQISNHLKQQQQEQQQRPSSSDEHESSPSRPSTANATPPVIVKVTVPPRRRVRPESAGSSFESNNSPPQHRKYVDDIHMDHSYDSNQGASHSMPSSGAARERRRHNRLPSSSAEYSTPVGSPRQSIAAGGEMQRWNSRESITSEIDKKKEGEKDMSDLLLMLTVTLRLPAAVVSPSAPVFDSDLDLNELTNSSNDSERTVVDNMSNGHSHDDNQEQESRSWTSDDQTMAGPLSETNKLHQRCRTLREDCLREISSEKLRRVLNIIDNVSEAQMPSEMIRELGEALYHKYSPQIFTLKFYEDNLQTHS